MLVNGKSCFIAIILFRAIQHIKWVPVVQNSIALVISKHAPSPRGGREIAVEMISVFTLHCSGI